MRLRRETGDYTIDMTAETVAVNKNQRAEQMLGAIITTASGMEVVLAVAENTTTITLTTVNGSYTYTKATGAIEAVEQASGQS